MYVNGFLSSQSSAGRSSLLFIYPMKAKTQQKGKAMQNLSWHWNYLIYSIYCTCLIYDKWDICTVYIYITINFYVRHCCHTKSNHEAACRAVYVVRRTPPGAIQDINESERQAPNTVVNYVANMCAFKTYTSSRYSKLLFPYRWSPYTLP